jgi:flavin reductase (DIM6/NTAB) family NADH-FMN oxidoreductase RutF
MEHTPVQFRRVMSLFATGVTVVTTIDDGVPVGLTVNSFTSLSLDPMLVLVCIARHTGSHDAILKARRFAASILAADQEGVSTIFAGAPSAERFDKVATFESPGGLRVISDALGYVEAAVLSSVDGGDHSIFVAEVTEMRIMREEAKPLVYYRGRYATP